VCLAAQPLCPSAGRLVNVDLESPTQFIVRRALAEIRQALKVQDARLSSGIHFFYSIKKRPQRLNFLLS
jgi:hypothetical protein